jgi:uncharacterized protein YbaR (Trm112 family)
MSTTSQFQFDAAALRRLACPACHGELRLGLDKLTCVACSRDYAIVHGIPVLIAERAETSQLPTHDR